MLLINNDRISDVNDKNDQENWYNIWRINKRLIIFIYNGLI